MLFTLPLWSLDLTYACTLNQGSKGEACEEEDQQYLFSNAKRRSLRGYQTSWIRLVDEKAVFDVLGHLEDAYSVIRQGYFFWEARMATMLPLDYGLSEMEAVQKD